jgi:hypothetical protein
MQLLSQEELMQLAMLRIQQLKEPFFKVHIKQIDNLVTYQ